jgi:hypothetical protein
VHNVNVPGGGSFNPLGALIAVQPVTLTKYHAYYYSDGSPAPPINMRVARRSDGFGLQTITVSNDTHVTGTLSPTFSLNTGDVLGFNIGTAPSNPGFNIDLVNVTLAP